MKICIAFLISVLLLSGWAQAEPMAVSWSQLMDESAQNFDDPFKALSISTLADVSSAVRLRRSLDRDDVPTDERTRMVERLRFKEKVLKEAGVDLDWLLSQRWVVAEKRKTAPRHRFVSLP